MKKILMIAASAAVLAASPALAQQTGWGAPAPHAYAPYAYAPAQRHSRVQGVHQGAFAYQPGMEANGAYAYGQAIGSDVVVSVDGLVIGQDPDPNIRASMQRDADMMLNRGGS